MITGKIGDEDGFFWKHAVKNLKVILEFPLQNDFKITARQTHLTSSLEFPP